MLTIKQIHEALDAARLRAEETVLPPPGLDDDARDAILALREDPFIVVTAGELPPELRARPHDAETGTVRIHASDVPNE